MTYRSTWCEIDLAQFRQNIRLLKDLVSTRLLLVVKADAYGHGISRMAAEASSTGVEMVGVATISEAEQLIDDEVDVAILVICCMDRTEIEFCVEKGIHFFAWRPDHFEWAERAAERFGRDPLLHIDIDTGMGRSGVEPHLFPSLLDSLSPGIRSSVVGMATHFVESGADSEERTKKQLDEFLSCVDAVRATGARPILHIANSAGTIRFPDSRLDMVRMGLAAYGISPSRLTTLPAGVAPVLTWKASVTNIKTIQKGEGVSYGWEWVASRQERVATLSVGYADGLRRSPANSNTVLLGGTETAVLGRVCMDQCVVLVPDGVSCEIGDVAILLGAQGEVELTADDLALRWDTNKYDAVSGIRNRVPRRYVG